ncbi:putative lipid II flippase FtsW [Aneurinibacillus migulanus]|uniref:Cell division protein FtsW n=1 Tax=Aneurinibacillus migulanus TaxID=47500 RepID=A0A0D1VKX9_ANEMI|nr:putative lipid II flippase FtsW [Aneurinibacillus migulanus]KIV60214.1 stage V sporulation protein E [Aneurinibacillus migulanus]KON97274.1 stage V sporulation protein E [Aneurinibacillus migulanus]MED0895850.1 putative lipid II flippase FtsW [Aneurinibacillus migulanus]MED1618863.1 putative lipid II flippase FtsW [Aneurinibacillus migulanus]SDJ54649.1 cell division protein FtsW [Aneurinibacillus migulanus]
MQRRGRPDFLLLFLTFGLLGFGMVMVYSASSIEAINTYNDAAYYAKKHMVRVLLGIFVMLVTMNIPFTFYKKHFFHILSSAYFLLVIVLIPGIGAKRNGARSWLDFGPLQIQPAEFAKIALIIYLAGIIAKKGKAFWELKTGFIPAVVVVVLFFLTIAIQPDFGSAAILALTAGVVIYVGGARLKYLLVLGVPLLAFSVIYTFSSQYRLQRILVFLDPWDDGMGGLHWGYQLTQSFSALAHGALTGTGLGKSIEKYLYLPEVHTDFIFAIIGEEFGFIGVLFFIITFLCLLWRMIFIGIHSDDLFSKLVGCGVASMIFIQAFINIGGVTGAIPLTGVPLPFISYGGSSLLVTLIGIGVTLSISREIDRKKIKEALDKIKDQNRSGMHKVNNVR